jgi:hypothetical protein
MSFTNRESTVTIAKYAVHAFFALAALSAAGCAADATSGSADPTPAGSASKEPLAHTHQALTGLIFDTWQGQLNHLGDAFIDGTPTQLDLGVADGWTCWLAGVHGNLTQDGWVEVNQNNGSYPYPNIPWGHWYLGLHGLPYGVVGGSAVCAPVTTGSRINFGPTTGFTSGNVLTNASINQWCGLGTIGGWDGAFSEPWAFATVSNNGFNAQPVVGGPTWTFSGQDVDATTTCASTPWWESVNGIWFYHIISNPGHTASFPMLNGNQNLPPGTVCFLTSVQGSLTNNSVTDGIGVSIDFSTNAWTMTASNGKSGWALCIL